MTVHIACSVLDGASYLEAFVQSVQRQTDADWRLWVRDDGSCDESADIVRRLAAADARIHLLESSGAPLGVVGSFGWLLDQVPADADYIMFADQDDVWLPHKIEASLTAMTDAERLAPGPMLVHTDLVVVDGKLNEIDASFWHYARITPESTALHHVVVKNVATGATALMNRALRELVGTIPPGAAVHDWWVACVAAAFGRVVAVRAPTVLYRQHAANTIGAQRPISALPWPHMAIAAPSAIRRTTKVRADIAAAARQARAFRDRYHDRLDPVDRQFLESYSRMPERAFFARKMDLFRMQMLPHNTLLQNVGILLRA